MFGCHSSTVICGCSACTWLWETAIQLTAAAHNCARAHTHRRINNGTKGDRGKEIDRPAVGWSQFSKRGCLREQLSMVLIWYSTWDGRETKEKSQRTRPNGLGVAVVVSSSRGSSFHEATKACRRAVQEGGNERGAMACGGWIMDPAWEEGRESPTLPERKRKRNLLLPFQTPVMEARWTQRGGQQSRGVREPE